MSTHDTPPTNRATLSLTKKRKFPSILATVIDTRNVDLRSIDAWLDGFLKLECQPIDKLIGALIMDYLRAHRIPDGKVIQVELIDLGLIDQTLIERLMNKLWKRLDREQHKYSERHHEKYQRLSAPNSGGHSARSCTSSSSASYGTRYAEGESAVYHHKNQIYHYRSASASSTSSSGSSGGGGGEKGASRYEPSPHDAGHHDSHPAHYEFSGRRWSTYNYMFRREEQNKEIMIESYM